MKRVAILDCGIGNIFSVKRAFELLNCDLRVIVLNQFRSGLSFDYLVLPGVGAFGHVMSQIRTRGFSDLIFEHVRHNKPFLGICVGMQVLFDFGLEFGEFSGLGIIEGRVRPLTEFLQVVPTLRVPRIGWFKVFSNTSRVGDADVLKDFPVGARMYFVHSFFALPARADAILLSTPLAHNVDVCAAVRVDNVFGTQFHPEKSGAIGLNFLRNFILS